jgi:hypothetical protein
MGRYRVRVVRIKPKAELPVNCQHGAQWPQSDSKSDIQLCALEWLFLAVSRHGAN